MSSRLLRRSLLVATGAAVGASLLATPVGAAPAATGGIRGTVTGVGDDGTVPVPGVTVRAGGKQTVTGSDGTYRILGLTPADVAVCFVVPDAAQTLSATGFLDHCHGSTQPAQSGDTGVPVTVTAGSTRVVDDTLPAAAALRGTVVDSAGSPVAGVAVSSDDGYDSVHATSASDGTFTLRGLLTDNVFVTADPGRLPVTATDPGAAYLRSPLIPVERGVVTASVLTLPPGGGISGRVVDSSGAAVAGALVAVSRPGTSTVNVVTGADGRWRAGHLATGAHSVCATPPSDADLLSTCTERVRVLAGVFTTASQTLPASASVYGVVTDRLGNPLQRVAVSAGSKTVLTGDDGRYRIAGLLPGASGACFRPDPEVAGGSSPTGYLAVCRQFTLAAGGKEVSPALAPGGGVTGRVVDDGGRPVADARVGVVMTVQDDGIFSAGDATDADGVYVIRNLPKGSYRTVVRRDEAGFGAAAGYEYQDDAGDVVVPGPRQVAGPDVVLLRRTGVDGVVEGPDGAALVGHPVRVTRGQSVGTFTTDVHGRWTATFYPPGTYQVCALAAGPSAAYPHGLAEQCVTARLVRGVVVRLDQQLSPASKTAG